MKHTQVILKLCGIACLMTVSAAHAHVKWFVDFDTTRPPEALAVIAASPIFWGLWGGSIVIMLLTSVLDRKVAALSDRLSWQPWLRRFEKSVPNLLRYGTSLFFLTLGVLYPNIVLTPELISSNPYLVYVHLIIAGTAFHRRSSVIAGIGILLLYAYAIDIFGLFHMLDYLVFIGVALYLIQETLGRRRQTPSSMELVRFTLCSCLAWGAIEKFAHPQLFFDLLTDRPYIAMGMNWTFVIMTAGFIEICCAFHLYTGRTASYACALVLAFFFFIAIVPFGFIDLVGHFLFIIPLLAIVASPVPRRPVCQSAVLNTGFFVAVMVLYFAVAYGSFYFTHHEQWPAGGAAPDQLGPGPAG